MRIYDPANGILYVHLATDAAARPAPSDSAGTCSRLPVGYANRPLRTGLDGHPGTRPDPAAGMADEGGTRPVLVVIPGGAQGGTDSDPSPAAPRLRSA
jgi:hypothetical protein